MTGLGEDIHRTASPVDSGCVLVTGSPGSSRGSTSWSTTYIGDTSRRTVRVFLSTAHQHHAWAGFRVSEAPR